MKTRMILVIFAALVLLAGCGKSADTDITATQTFEAALETALAATLEAESASPPEPTLQDAEPSNPAENTPELVPTFTPLPTIQALTPTPTQQQAAATSTSEPSTPCYRAEMISETIPDGTVFRPGAMFTKIWVIRNTGVCEWTEDFTWTLVEGEDFGVPTVITLNRKVMPGEDLEVKLEMKTPMLEGAYQGTYQILTEDGGSVTPLGFWVLIISQKSE